MIPGVSSNDPRKDTRVLSKRIKYDDINIKFWNQSTQICLAHFPGVRCDLSSGVTLRNEDGMYCFLEGIDWMANR